MSKKMFFNNSSSYLILLVLAILFVITSPVASLELQFPLRCRIEGRISLVYPFNGQVNQYHLAFTESIDATEVRSAVTIGYVATEPVKYFSRKNSPIITLDSNGQCSNAADTSSFIPELSWFIERMMPIPLAQYTVDFPHYIGPSGLIKIFIAFGKGELKFNFSRSETHRNIVCNIYSGLFLVPGTTIAIRLDVYVPSTLDTNQNAKTNYFSLRATTVSDQNQDLKDKPSFLIDFYHIESLDKDQEKYEKFKENFNIPIGRGCSELLPQIQPEIRAQSFSLKYKQKSTSANIFLAYDHEAGLLRKESIGKSVRIWDITEDILYEMDNDITETLKTVSVYEGNSQSCAVLHVVDDQLNYAFRPYDKSGESLELLKMIGASNLAYLGTGTVRELPCLIYEGILLKPPTIFTTTDNQLNPKVKVDYIIQFFVLKGQQIELDSAKANLPADSFWPARIVLLRRYKDSSVVELVDQLEVFDFSWSLNGWDTKAAQLFMASECFDDENEQIRLELALTFDRLHKRTVKSEDKAILAYNKFKLEYDFINDIFGLFQISKMHLSEYELMLRPNHINVNLVIADRKEEKRLVYYGEGQLPEPNSYETNRVLLTAFDEESCVLMSSHIADISLVVFCPQVSALGEGAFCTAVYDENDPSIMHTTSNKSDQQTCSVYRFVSSVMSKRGTSSVHEKSASLLKHPFEFVAKVPKSNDKTEVLKGVISNYDVSQEIQLITIDHYMFTIDQSTDKDSPERLVRSFDSIEYNNEGDCSKMCNLDSNCKSYSYCSNKDDHQCTLSSLDIRASKVQDQLVNQNSPLSENKQIVVNGAKNTKYNLQLVDNCDIHERDYLNMFRQTDEILRLDPAIAKQFKTAPTTFECAKQSVDLELKSKSHHIAMFAYCSTLNTCLMDENLFTDLKTKSTEQDRDDDRRVDDELLCRVYRKKYQTYFKVSSHVNVQQADQQVSLELKSVEECARACWIRLGQVCASFDYCSPGNCLINTLGNSSSEVKTEMRSGCLHYDRDLSLDELRKQHLIGKHEVLAEKRDEPTTFGGVLLKLLTYSLVFVAFVYGLILGRKINDKMDAVTVLRQSISAGPGVSAAQMFGFNGLLDVTQDQNGFNNNAFPMDVIKSGATDRELLEEDF